jgi:hypothetical protein
MISNLKLFFFSFYSIALFLNYFSTPIETAWTRSSHIKLAQENSKPPQITTSHIKL